MIAGNRTRTKDKYRIVYTEQQKVELEKEFLYNQYITIQRKAELAGSIGLSDRQVREGLHIFTEQELIGFNPVLFLGL